VEKIKHCPSCGELMSEVIDEGWYCNNCAEVLYLMEGEDVS